MLSGGGRSRKALLYRRAGGFASGEVMQTMTVPCIKYYAGAVRRKDLRLVENDGRGASQAEGNMVPCVSRRVYDTDSTMALQHSIADRGGLLGGVDALSARKGVNLAPATRCLPGQGPDGAALVRGRNLKEMSYGSIACQCPTTQACRT